MDAEDKAKGDRFVESASRLLSEWSAIAKAAAKETEKFVREQPVAGAAIAFFAGLVIGRASKR